MIDLCDLLNHWAQSNHIHRWDRPEQQWELWARNQGWLRQDQPASSLRCPECQELVELKSCADRQGKRSHYLVCTICGLQPVEDDQLLSWRWRNDTIVEAFATLFSVSGKPAILVHDQVWMLGRIVLGTKRPVLVLIRNRLGLQELRSLPWLNHNKSVVALFPNSQDATSWNGQILILGELVHLATGRLQLNETWRQSLMGITDESSHRKLPERKRRDERTRNVETITNFLMEDIRRRKDHAKAVFLGSGTSRLLTPLKQKDICNATGLSKSTVCKCLKDKKSTMIQLLWRVSKSQNVQDCLNFKLPSTKLSSIIEQQHEMIDSIEDRVSD